MAQPAGSKVELMPGNLLSRKHSWEAAEGSSVVFDLQKRGLQRSELLARDGFISIRTERLSTNFLTRDILVARPIEIFRRSLFDT